MEPEMKRYGSFLFGSGKAEAEQDVEHVEELEAVTETPADIKTHQGEI